MWHNDAGLVVSPYNRTLPAEIDEPLEYTNSSSKYQHPKKRSDEVIWLAFFPIRDVNRGPLFSVLGITREEGHASIEEVLSGDGPVKYRLVDELRRSWAQLEDSLIDVVESLMDEQKQCPPIQYPRWPQMYGYRDAHKTREGALNAIRGAKGAFRMLAAVVSFALSLWLTEYEDDCFERAFSFLANRARDPVPRVWLDALATSSICDFKPGARPGAFVNPFTSCWAPGFKYFVRACVPIWLLWGDNWRIKQVAHPFMLEHYCPPADWVEMAKKTELEFSRVILPSEKNYVPREGAQPAPNYNKNYRTPQSSTPIAPWDPRRSPEHDLPNPHTSNTTPKNTYHSNSAASPTNVVPSGLENENVERAAIVNRGSGQKAYETWEEFAERMAAQAELIKTKESPREKQSRESREQYAAKSGWSNKSKVFVWEQDQFDKAFYRRTAIAQNAEVYEDLWYQTTPYQRRYWGHLNQWDVCPHLPNQPPGAKPILSEQELDDLEDDIYHLPMQPISTEFPKVTNEDVGPAMLQTVRAAFARGADLQIEEYHFPHASIIQYLRFRHGFDAEIGTWNPRCHSEGSHILNHDEGAVVVKKLLYEPIRTELSIQTSTAIVDFWNTALNLTPTLESLPSAWDISPAAPEDILLVCNRNIVACQRVFGKNNKDMFILLPGIRSQHQSEWFVATSDATTVLLVYRSNWGTMIEIARGLLELGIPFRTVVEMSKSKVPSTPWSYNSAGLGYRPSDFHFTEDDYLQYIYTRNQVLKSSYGRAVRMAGGITGRIAAEIVPEAEVLGGPVYCNEVIGKLGDVCYVDDKLDDESLDMVCGTYRITLKNAENSHSKTSLWPRYNQWFSTGLAGDQWSPRAEEFYQQRVRDFENGTFVLHNSKEWKIKYRFDVKPLSGVLASSQALASNFIRNSSLF